MTCRSDGQWATPPTCSKSSKQPPPRAGSAWRSDFFRGGGGRGRRRKTVLFLLSISIIQVITERRARWQARDSYLSVACVQMSPFRREANEMQTSAGRLLIKSCNPASKTISAILLKLAGAYKVILRAKVIVRQTLLCGGSPHSVCDSSHLFM